MAQALMPKLMKNLKTFGFFEEDFLGIGEFVEGRGLVPRNRQSSEILMSLSKSSTSDIVKKYGSNDKDTGSTAVQIALIKKDRGLAKHFKDHKKIIIPELITPNRER